jgi:site-specific DNA-methyltransferase (adenine-specific)
VTDPVQIGDATLYLGDCLEILPTLGPVDAVVTDPPYGIGNFVQTTGRLRGSGDNRGKPVDWNEAPPPPEFFDHIKRLSNHRIVWGANFFNSFEDKGGAIVWIKRQKMPNFSKADIASCTHFQKTEIVEIPWTNFTKTHKGETDHPCERPIALYEWCIDYLPKCHSFLDPYMGSGSVGVACHRLGREFIGIEIEPKYFDIACKRIEDAQRQGNLFEAEA